jgi:hypothetical protein
VNIAVDRHDTTIAPINDMLFSTRSPIMLLGLKPPSTERDIAIAVKDIMHILIIFRRSDTTHLLSLSLLTIIALLSLDQRKDVKLLNRRHQT